MQEAQNTKVVQEAYAAFGRGDVQGILDRLTDDVIWKGVYGAAAYVPTSGERRGKEAVATFFKQVAETMKFSRFEPKEFIAAGDKVVALGSYSGTTSIGKSFESEFSMVFTLRNGKVSHFQEFTDSAAINAAYAVAGAVV
jgi:ketosteroid isomerase-like protein